MKCPEEKTKKPQAGGSNYGLSEAGDILPASPELAAAGNIPATPRARLQAVAISAIRSLRQHSSHFLPSHCLLCGASSQTQILCPACASDLPRLPPKHCPLCLESTSYGERCGRCLTQPPSFDGAFAAFTYDFPLDKLVQTFKYGQQLALARWFAAQLAHLLAPQQAQHGWTTLIPLPLHHSRLRQRGFNQALEMARPLGKILRLACDAHGLQRLRPGAPQASLPLKERRQHLRGAFACRQDYHGQRILLLDDVLTSGSTANECARTLKRHGAASVHVAVVARALRD